MATDPSHNVHQELLPHVHLINTYRYPLMPRIDIQEVTKWLLAAPKIARDTAPFFWTYLDAPQDGTILLTWQPLQRMGTNMASDGYIYGVPETLYQQEVPGGNGLIMEVYHQRAGYRPGESFIGHCRRRFRLTPPKVPTPNTPQVDPSLWIVHWGPVEHEDRISIAHVPFNPQTHAIMNARAQLQRAGQITRKEFMLSDRVNWPQIPLPREARGQAVYASPGHGRPVPQHMAYPPHGAGAIGPPSKRARHAPPGAGQQPPPMMPNMPIMDSAYDDDEDISRGDMYDIFTPRDLSKARYQQNHEWMEEVLSSAFRFGLVKPSDLGLGLSGELKSVTEGIFETQGVKATRELPKKPYIGRLDPELASEFRKRVAAKIDSTNDEIADIKAEHAKLMTRFKSSSLIKHAEQDLRLSVAETGSEIWRLEGFQEENDEDGQKKWDHPKHQKKVDDVVAAVEGALGKKAEVVHDVDRIQEGGYQEPAPEPIPEPVVIPVPASQAEPEPAAAAAASATVGSASMSRQASQAGSQTSGIMIGDSDIDMGGTAAGLLDQMHTGFSSTSTPINNFPTPQPQLSAIPSSVATPANANVPSPQNAQPSIPEEDDAMEGVTMENAEEEEAKPAAAAAASTDAAAAAAPDQGTGSNDEWVVVPKGGVSPDPPAIITTTASPSAAEAPATTTAAAATAVAATSGSSQGEGKGEGEAVTTTTTTTTAADEPAAKAAASSAEGTPAGGDGGSMDFEGDNNDFSSLGDLDTAGDALASYDPPSLDGPPGDLGEGLDLHMDMEDSAFGDAFHGVGQSHEGDGDTPADSGL